MLTTQHYIGESTKIESQLPYLSAEIALKQIIEAQSFRCNNEKYHHIIDPATGMPSQYWRAVTIVCQDSGVADALSTALFLLPLEEGKALLEKFDAQAIWIDQSGEEYMTPGFEEMMRT